MDTEFEENQANGKSGSGDDSSDDEDYVPGKDPNENVVSEEEDEKAGPSADNDSSTSTTKSRKRKGKALPNGKAKIGGKASKKAKKRKRNADDDEDDDDEEDVDFDPGEDKSGDEEEEEEKEDPETVRRREEEEKERTNKLWSNFLLDVEQEKLRKKEAKEKGYQNGSGEKTVTKIYEFAGEKVKVQEKVKIKDPKPSTSKAAASTNGTNDEPPAEDSDTPKPKKYRISFLSGNPADIGLAGGKNMSAREGLANLLNALHQRNKKIGTLEKTKLDWETYKRDQNIEEELESHNKSKHGFIDKQEFLQRADLRQFEIEKEARAKRRRPLPK